MEFVQRRRVRTRKQVGNKSRQIKHLRENAVKLTLFGQSAGRIDHSCSEISLS